jgi:predicted ATPase
LLLFRISAKRSYAHNIFEPWLFSRFDRTSRAPNVEADTLRFVIRELAVSGYRSVRKIRLPLQQVNVLTGPNGCGKSNLYNAMFLLARVADGSFGQVIAQEGGMPSVLWAGATERRVRTAPPSRLLLSVELDRFGYELHCGLRQGSPLSLFSLDPEIRGERIWLTGSHKSSIMERKGARAAILNSKGKMEQYPSYLYPSESLLAQLSDPNSYPEMFAVREETRSWRFYHHFRTDQNSPLRRPQPGVLTPVLSHDGLDLAAALQTIIEIGLEQDLEESIAFAFKGAKLEVRVEATGFRIQLHMPGLLRPLEAPELSDGTLRYLCLIAALLSPRPASLLAFNEPETSLHPTLLEPLAKLIARAAENSQLWIATHSFELAKYIEKFSGQPPVRLEIEDGETRLVAPTPAQEQEAPVTRPAG